MLRDKGDEAVAFLGTMASREGGLLGGRPDTNHPSRIA